MGYVVRIVVSIAVVAVVCTLVVVGLWCINLAAFNLWAGGGPPTDNPDLYRHRGLAFLIGSAIAFIGAIVIAVAWLKRRVRQRHR